MSDLWSRFQECRFADEALGVAVDVSRMAFPDGFLARMEPSVQAAFAAMGELEGGAIANPDEQRMVGHYWLRAPELAPTPEIRQEIEATDAAIRVFAAKVHAGKIAPSGGDRFRNLLLIGIGGSALGPQLVADALGPSPVMRPFFFDNTDPDGMQRVLDEIAESGGLEQTLTVVASKSGGTKETRNGMLVAEAAYRARGLDFGRHAAAITGADSELDRYAREHGWLERFPMWDWVGGRTSVCSAVGLVPMALLGIDTAAFLRGAREMDALTRVPETRRNPAALLALTWHHVGKGRGEKAMVVLPYRDRLLLFARYLQQLVMESLGKERDLEGRVVHQGLTVYGNKGSTDQHAYVQQLRDGLNNFFVTLIQVLDDGTGPEMSPAGLEVEPGVTSGDYLLGFLLGTRRALAENDRESVTITLRTLDAASLGALIALFERAVGLYAQLIGINAYHQPGVEAGKKAAQAVIALQGRLVDALREAGRPLTAEAAAATAGAPEEAETAYHILSHLAANPGRGITRHPAPSPAEETFSTE